MKSTLLALALTAAGLTGMAPRAHARAGESITFNMVKSAGAAQCLKANAHGRVTLSDLGPVQNMHVEVSNLPPNTEFTLFVINTPTAPFVPAWYQGDLTTNEDGNGVIDVTGKFDSETFILNPNAIPASIAVQLDHLGIWFADPTDAANNGCAGTPTPFDGDHTAGIQVLNTSNFAATKGPLLKLQ
jgi:hypothetical protein